MSRANKREMPRFCAFCEHASLLSDENTVLCDKKGVVDAFHRCRKFRYDLLKRKPLAPLMPELPDPSDLLLDE